MLLLNEYNMVVCQNDFKFSLIAKITIVEKLLNTSQESDGLSIKVIKIWSSLTNIINKIIVASQTKQP